MKSTTLRDVVAGGLLAAFGFSLAIGAIVNRPAVASSANFLFDDEGHNLLIADTLLSGGSLYRDVFSQYGPIPAYAHAMAAWGFGNTPLVYLCLLALVSGANVALSYALIRRGAGMWIAVFVTGVGIVPVLMIPGALAGGYTSAAYMPFEQMALLLVALAWRAPGARTVRRSLVIGCLLGMWQGIRFGGAVGAGVAILMIDVLCVRATGSDVERWRAWGRSLVVVAAAGAAVESIWVVAALATLPRPLALDVLWPSYILQGYEVWTTAAGRWLWWEGWRLMVAQYLLPLSAGMLGVVALARWAGGLRPNRAEQSAASVADQGAVFIPLCFYLIASLYLFRMVHHFRQFLWALVPAAGWELQRRTSAIRAGIGLLWLPGFATMVRANVVPVAAASLLVTVSLPTGGTIQTSPRMAERIRFLERFTSSEVRGAPVLFVQRGEGAASGWHYAYRVPHATRHTWFFAATLIRPYEVAAFIDALNRTSAFIDCSAGDGPPQAAGPDLPFPPAVNQAILSRLDPWTTEAGCRVYHIR